MTDIPPIIYDCEAHLNASARRAELDKKFHEYKLAALTGRMIHTSTLHGFCQGDADAIAVNCDMVARAMAALDRAGLPAGDLDESGDGP